MNPVREKLPGIRASVDRRFRIMFVEDDPNNPGVAIRYELKLFVVAGMYDDGRLGELFIYGEKLGTFMSGIFDAMATTISIALQHGVPLQQLTEKYRHATFGPAQKFGLVDPDFKKCTSPMDLIAQWLDLRFPGGRFNAPASALCAG